jgi:hypothetical protein
MDYFDICVHKDQIKTDLNDPNDLNHLNDINEPNETTDGKNI